MKANSDAATALFQLAIGDRNIPPDVQLEHREKIGSLIESVGLLEKKNKRRAQVIDLLFGLTDGRPLKQSEIAPIINVTDTRVGQIKEAALRDLKRIFVAKIRA